jgi:hypothetical protein
MLPSSSVMAGPPSDFQMSAGLLLVARVRMSVSLALFTFCVSFNSRTKLIGLSPLFSQALHEAKFTAQANRATSQFHPVQETVRNERFLSSELEASKTGAKQPEGLAK